MVLVGGLASAGMRICETSCVTTHSNVCSADGRPEGVCSDAVCGTGRGTDRDHWTRTGTER